MLFYAFIFLVFGFLLAWIAQMVSREEVSLGMGIGILIFTYITWAFARVALKDAEAPLPTAVPIGVLFGVLTLLLGVVAKLSWKHAAIIGAIYTVLITLVGLGVDAALSAK